MSLNDLLKLKENPFRMIPAIDTEDFDHSSMLSISLLISKLSKNWE
jgi:hypothetical protein